MRGYAPTAVPADGRYQTRGARPRRVRAARGARRRRRRGDHRSRLGRDRHLHRRQPRTRPVAPRGHHGRAPDRGGGAAGSCSTDQLKKSWYMFFFQHALADVVVGDGRPGVHRRALGGLVARLRRRRGHRAREGRAARPRATWPPRSATTGPRSAASASIRRSTRCRRRAAPRRRSRRCTCTDAPTAAWAVEIGRGSGGLPHLRGVTAGDRRRGRATSSTSRSRPR